MRWALLNLLLLKAAKIAEIMALLETANVLCAAGREKDFCGVFV